MIFCTRIHFGELDGLLSVDGKWVLRLRVAIGMVCVCIVTKFCDRLNVKSVFLAGELHGAAVSDRPKDISWVINIH